MLVAVAKKLVSDYSGNVPSTKVQLKTLGIDDTVASIMMQQVFASTELVVGLHARKILVAVDLYDWEETGVAQKRDVKMAKVSADHIKKSLKVWLPQHYYAGFHDLMETIGETIGSNQVGMWGRVKGVINNHINTKDKDQLIADLTHITQFYVATKTRRNNT